MRHGLTELTGTVAARPVRHGSGAAATFVVQVRSEACRDAPVQCYLRELPSFPVLLGLPLWVVGEARDRAGHRALDACHVEPLVWSHAGRLAGGLTRLPRWLRRADPDLAEGLGYLLGPGRREPRPLLPAAILVQAGDRLSAALDARRLALRGAPAWQRLVTLPRKGPPTRFWVSVAARRHAREE